MKKYVTPFQVLCLFISWSGFKGSSVFFCGAQQILTRLRGLRDYEGWSFSFSELVFACGLCWPFFFMLWRLLFGVMKPPVLFLCILLFCQSWAFEFVIDGEWEDELVRCKIWNWKFGFACMYSRRQLVEKWWSLFIHFLVRSFGSVPSVWEIQGKFS